MKKSTKKLFMIILCSVASLIILSSIGILDGVKDTLSTIKDKIVEELTTSEDEDFFGDGLSSDSESESDAGSVEETRYWVYGDYYFNETLVPTSGMLNKEYFAIVDDGFAFATGGSSNKLIGVTVVYMEMEADTYDLQLRYDLLLPSGTINTVTVYKNKTWSADAWRRCLFGIGKYEEWGQVYVSENLHEFFLKNLQYYSDQETETEPVPEPDPVVPEDPETPQTLTMDDALPTYFHNADRSVNYYRVIFEGLKPNTEYRLSWGIDPAVLDTGVFLEMVDGKYAVYTATEASRDLIDYRGTTWVNSTDTGALENMVYFTTDSDDTVLSFLMLRYYHRDDATDMELLQSLWSYIKYIDVTEVT